ncbi:coiled-coil domain-containing protein 74A-like isoform X2 [Pogona vitticeps]
MPSSGFPPLPSPPQGGARPGPPPVPSRPPLRPPAQPPAPAPGAASSSSEEEGWKRAAAELERSLRFLQGQHAETLRQLHQEVELLRRQNRDLHYKLIMHPMLQKTEFSPSISPAKVTPRSSVVGKADSSSSWTAEELSKEDSEQLEEKPTESAGPPPKGEERVAEASAEGRQEEDRATAQEEAEAPSPEPTEGPPVGVPGRDVEPPAKLSSRGRSTGSPYRRFRGTAVCDRATSPVRFPSESQDRSGEMRIPAASSNPFLVNVLPSHVRKPPTLEECEVVIRQLWNINHMQMQELMYLRSCLEDIHKTRRIPEESMLAGHLGSRESGRLPRMKNAPKTWILTPLPAAERAVLPALKQTLGNAFAERQKRTQAVQRKRLHRTVL